MPRSAATTPTIGSARIVVESSPVFELITAAIAVAHREKKPQPWIEELEAKLGTAAIDAMVAELRRYRFGLDIVELATGAPDLQSVETFLAYVKSLSEREVTFYLLGRMHRREELPQSISRATVAELLERSGTVDSTYHLGADIDWADDVTGARDEIVRVLATLWESWLRDRQNEIRPRWQAKIDEVDQFLDQYGGLALWQGLTDKDDLPMRIPAEMPYEIVRIIPTCTSGLSTNYLFGYGEVDVLVRCDDSLDDTIRQRRGLDEMILVTKALGDKNRVRMLRMLVRKSHPINGKQLAEHLGLSPSVVSRHLQQLRSAGLVREVALENHAVTYEVEIDALRALSEHLVRYVTVGDAR